MKDQRNWDSFVNSFENNNYLLYYKYIIRITYRELRIPSATLLFQVWFVMERKKKKKKTKLHTYKKNAKTCVLPWIFFPFTLVTVRNATKRCSCCVVFSCFSTLTWSSHTHPYGVCEGNYPGENSFWNRGFFVDIRHTLSSHSNHNTIWNQFPLEILH